jgi:hypothetical protein
MPKPSTKTPERFAKMLDLHRQGGSAREIADALKVTHGTILIWLKQAGLKPNGGQGSREDRERPQPTGTVAALAEAQQRLAELTSAPAPANFDEVLARMRHDFGKLSGALEKSIEDLTKGAANLTDIERGMRIQNEYAVRIRELTPREPEKPENDPANLEAAADVRRKLASLVARAEDALKCIACGAHPFVRKVTK